MIFVTDIGKDIDDSVALTYALLAGVPIKTIITTSKDSIKAANICHNISKALNAPGVKIYAGSTEPLKKKGISHGCTYTGKYTESDEQTEKFEPLKVPADDIIAICPLTDVAKLLEHQRAKRIMFMGQANKEGLALVPDMEAYNFRCDPFASEIVFQYQEDVPFGFITKALAYRVPFTKTDFQQFADTGHPVGKFLQEHALETFEHFKEQVPELYERVYQGTDNISYCYDPLTVLAITNPDLFIFEKFEKHRIGVSIEAEKAKSKLMQTILAGLKK